MLNHVYGKQLIAINLEGREKSDRNSACAQQIATQLEAGKGLDPCTGSKLSPTNDVQQDTNNKGNNYPEIPLP